MKEATQVKSVLAVRAQRLVANAFCTAMDARDNNGTLVTQVCNSAREQMRGKPFLSGDIDGIVSAIASDRGWKGDAIKVRSSEVRTVLRSYATLPEAIKIALKSGTCNYHFAVKLARFIGKGKSPDAAVKEARKKGTHDAVPLEGRIASLLRKLFAEKRSKRTDAMKAWDVLGLKGDIAKAR